MKETSLESLIGEQANFNNFNKKSKFDQMLN